MKNFFIKDLKPGMSMFGESFVVKSYKKGNTKQNKPFIDIELVDRTGLIKGKVWSDAISAARINSECSMIMVEVWGHSVFCFRLRSSPAVPGVASRRAGLRDGAACIFSAAFRGSRELR